MQLFESLCEHHSVRSLAYLMHLWSFVEGSENGLRMLRQSLLELHQRHSDEMDAIESLLSWQIVLTLAALDGAVEDEPEHSVAWALETYLPGTRH
jgi:hypothetical protein